CFCYRLEDQFDSASTMSDIAPMNKARFNIETVHGGRAHNNPTKSFRRGVIRSSQGLKSMGISLKTGVTNAMFPEDLKVSDKMIFDPQDKSIQLWNRLFVISCIFSVSIDPLFFYLPIFSYDEFCISIDSKLAKTITTLRTIADTFYLTRMALQFRTAFTAPSSRVFGRGELVVDPTEIAKHYLRRYFFVDLLSILPVPQIVVWSFLYKAKESGVAQTKRALLLIVIFQYIPRFCRFIPLTAELKKSSGVFAETAWAGAAYYLLWYMLASHIVGALWYLLAVQREDTCWQIACKNTPGCFKKFLYCENYKDVPGFSEWNEVRRGVLSSNCSPIDEHPTFDYGIYTQALVSGIVASEVFLSKYCYCLWWGLQNLRQKITITFYSTLGQGLQTSTYPAEVMFSIFIVIFGLILFAMLIGNMQASLMLCTSFYDITFRFFFAPKVVMHILSWGLWLDLEQTYLQSLMIRLEEMRIKRRDSEQWMHHRLLPPDLRERVRRYDQYRWLETRGVDEESIVQTLPKDLRRDIKRHLCLNLVRRRLKPALYTERTYIVREGDPVDEMLFIIRGRLESVTTDGGRSGFFNRILLKEGAFCGEELLTWALDPKAGSHLPSSTRTVRALTEVEAFALIADEMKFVATQFRRLQSRQVQHTFRFYSQQWRTWGACYIQATWRRYTRRKYAEIRHKEEEEEEEEEEAQDNEEEVDYDYNEGTRLTKTVEPSDRSPQGMRAGILASRFAANAMRGVHRLRNTSTSSIGLVKLQKPPEPDFEEE
ncbi:Cyclic nucleotide-binding domain, partial [Dillenia turbinata]